MTKPEVVKLEGEKREPGSKVAGKLRDDLRVPSVLYGPEIKENIHFHVNELELEKILSNPQTKLQELRVDGKTYKTLLKRVEYDPITDRPLHADFYVLADNRRVTLRVPVRLKGTPVGVTDGGGRVFQPLRIVRVKVLPAVIPAQFEVDISNLEIGDSVHVSELDMEGITPLDDSSRTIVTVTPPKSEALFTTTAIIDEDELEEGELPEGEEADLAEGETPEGEDAEESDDETAKQ